MEPRQESCGMYGNCEVMSNTKGQGRGKVFYVGGAVGGVVNFCV